MGQPITQTTRVELPAQDDRNPEIERMWAFQKVEQEMAALRDSGPSEARVQKIVQLCEGFSIAGEYASFIVLENDAEYKRWAIERRNAIRVKRDDASRIRLRDELQRQRDESLAKLGPVTPEPAAAPKQLAVNTPSNPSAASPTSPQGLPQSLPPVTQPSPPASNSIRPTYVPDNSGSSWGGSGGGALDPLTATLALSLAAAAGATRRKKRPARSAGE
jgi:Ca-activated chloride channel family protein